jgi:hypothetical protein
MILFLFPLYLSILKLMSSVPTYPSSFDANLLAFARILREHNLLIGPQEVSLCLEALRHINLAEREDLRLSLRSILAKTPFEQRHFDHLFEDYWSGGLLLAKTAPSAIPLPKPKRVQTLSMMDSAQSEEGDKSIETAIYSAQAVEAKGDTATRTDAVEALSRLLKRLTRQLFTKPSRRWEHSSRRAQLADLRRTIRQSLSKGGELLELRYKARKLGKTRLIFVFDVSGSMMMYSHFLLQLAYAMVRQKGLGTTEVFGFSTELYRLTSHLQRGGVKEAIRTARLAMPGRSGGTKIGMCLHDFIERYGYLLDSKTVIIINSDGWDTGDLDILRTAMRTLHERSNRLIWLNPLAGSPGYEPIASGMQTALPYIDVFAPSHNFESLQALEQRLMRRR